MLMTLAIAEYLAEEHADWKVLSSGASFMMIGRPDMIRPFIFIKLVERQIKTHNCDPRDDTLIYYEEQDILQQLSKTIIGLGPCL